MTFDCRKCIMGMHGSHSIIISTTGQVATVSALAVNEPLRYSPTLTRWFHLHVVSSSALVVLAVLTLLVMSQSSPIETLLLQ